MAGLYLASATPQAGKTAIATGIARRLQVERRRVAYFKPVSQTVQRVADEWVDADARFMRELLSLDASPAALTPFPLTPEAVEHYLQTPTTDGLDRIRSAYELLREGRDLVITEGPTSLDAGEALGVAPARVAGALGCAVVLVVRYRNDLVVDEVVAAARVFGDQLAGVIVNAVPTAQLDHVRETLVTFMTQRGVAVLGLVPWDRNLAGVMVGELIEAVDGQALNASEHLDEIVQNLMIGTMSVDSGIDYFRRKSDKAVIASTDRPDIMIVALQTDTKCIIATGHGQINPVVLARAQEMGVPMVVTRRSMLDTVERVEQVFGAVRFHQTKKVRRARDLMAAHLDWEALRQTLGLPATVAQ